MNVVQVRRHAHYLVRLAVLSGSLLRPDACEECGRQCKPEGAHYDYARPLDVRWLCHSCHWRWDRSEPKVHTAVAIAAAPKQIVVTTPYAGLMRLGQAAELFNVHPGTVRDWAEAGLIAAIRTPTGQYRVSRAHVAELLKKQPATKATTTA